MIGYVRGKLAHKEPPTVLVDVNGVGYELEAPMSTIFRLPEVGREVSLRTHLVIGKNDSQQTLYGFATEDERRLFRTLLKVSGVGAKMALTILSGISVEAFVECVRNEDKAALSRLPGIGRKTAERLILDVRDRLAEGTVSGFTPAGPLPDGQTQPRTEAFNALVSLGYRPPEARKMIDSADAALDSTEEILRAVLKSAAT